MQAITCFNWYSIYILSAHWIIPSTRWLGSTQNHFNLKWDLICTIIIQFLLLP